MEKYNQNVVKDKFFECTTRVKTAYGFETLLFVVNAESKESARMKAKDIRNQKGGIGLTMKEVEPAFEEKSNE